MDTALPEAGPCCLLVVRDTGAHKEVGGATARLAMQLRCPITDSHVHLIPLCRPHSDSRVPLWACPEAAGVSYILTLWPLDRTLGEWLQAAMLQGLSRNGHLGVRLEPGVGARGTREGFSRGLHTKLLSSLCESA